MVLKDKIKLAYSVFKNYAPMNDSCTFCYDQEEIEYYQTQPVQEIEVSRARKLLWETGDHWESSEVFRYYLPRILEILFPPYKEEELYPGHLLETLKYHQFKLWAKPERELVESVFAEAKIYFDNFDEQDWNDWDAKLLQVIQA